MELNFKVLKSSYDVDKEEKEEKEKNREDVSCGSLNNDKNKMMVTPKIIFSSDGSLPLPSSSPLSSSSSSSSSSLVMTGGYRSSPLLSSSNSSGSSNSSSGGYGKIGFISGVDSAPFSIGKSATNIGNEFGCLEMSTPAFRNSNCIGKNCANKPKKVKVIDVSNQDMEACGMKECEVFVPCATLEMDENVELVLPGLIREERDIQRNTADETHLQINETSCVVSNGIEECMQMVPSSIARVSDDMDLQVFPKEYTGNSSRHIPQIEGCVMIQHKRVLFAVHLYGYSTDCTSTIIEFQRRSGDVFVFQKFYEGCLQQLRKSMKNLRNCNYFAGYCLWSDLPDLDNLDLGGLEQSGTCWWDQSNLDLLANLIKEESEEAMDMLGCLCVQMEKHKSLRRQVLQHKMLMEQIAIRVLTHQDPCFVRLGLVALYISLSEETIDSVKEICQSSQMLAFIIALLNSSSTFVLRHAVRLLALLATICECPWKLNESQQKILNDCIPRLRYRLLETHTWSAVYATEFFITKDMFERITFHPRV